ncbi:hypothetical protein TWF481_009618 [Arthrobotrys musiformis]|uniref:Uncharacterized protein n=1 Tax=Arthrobotrys musiformis TaxID=47236 RepID=A0AAV9W4B3_9PEZI
MKENNAEDGIRYGSETTYVSWSTSPARKPADTSQRTATREEVFEKRKRHKMHESRQKTATARASGKKEKHTSRKKKKERTKEPRIPQPAFGALASSAVESEHLSGARLTVRPQISAGLFHKGRVSRLRTRAALPDLSFCEMDFLQNGAPRPENRPIQQSGEEKKSNSKRQAERDTNEEISTFFKRATPSRRKEDADAPSSRSRQHAAPSVMQDQPNQAAIQPRQHGTASRCKPSSRDHQARHPLEETSHRSSSCLQTSPCRNKTSISTPNYLEPRSERPIFGSISGNTHSISRSQSRSSETDNPVVTWLRKTPREFPMGLENDLRDKRTYSNSSGRDFNRLSNSPNPRSAKMSTNSPAAAAPQGRIEVDLNVGERSSIHPENVMTGGVADSSPPCLQVERPVPRWQFNIAREPDRYFGPHDSIFGRPIHTIPGIDLQFERVCLPSPQRLTSRFEPGPVFNQPRPNDNGTRDEEIRFHRTVFSTPRDEQVHLRGGSVYWDDKPEITQPPLHRRAREVEATSPYYNNRDLVWQERREHEREHHVAYDMGLDDRAMDRYTNLEADFQSYDMRRSAALDEFTFGDDTGEYYEQEEFRPERHQSHQPRGGELELPEPLMIGPMRFWRRRQL